MSKNDFLFWRKVADDVIAENLVLQGKLTEKEQEVVDIKRQLYELELLQARYERYANRHNRGIMADDSTGMIKTKEGFYLR